MSKRAPGLDPYRVLGLPRSATPEDIKMAGKRARRKAHPDAGGNAEDFQRASTAIAILADPKRRRQFDETGEWEEPEPEQADAAALTVIAQVLNGMLLAEDEPPTHRDIVDMVKGAIRQSIREYENERTPLVRAERRCERVLKRFVRKKGEGSNALQAILERNVRHISEKRAVQDGHIRDCQRALQILDDYRFEADAEQYQHRLVGFGHIFNSTNAT